MYRWLRICYPDGRTETVTDSPDTEADRHVHQIHPTPDGYTIRSRPPIEGQVAVTAELIPREWVVGTPFLI